jgi:hypothetical protein
MPLTSYQCPDCGFTLHRIGRRGVLEGLLSRFFGLRPYECEACGKKSYRITKKKLESFKSGRPRQLA